MERLPDAAGALPQPLPRRRPKRERSMAVQRARPWQLAALCIVAGWRGCTAWSKEGHYRVLRVARDSLKAQERKKVKALLELDLLDIADWEITMTKKFKETDALHWHRQDPEWTCGKTKTGKGGTQLGDRSGHIKCDGKGAESGSLFCALAYFFEHFAHDALLREFPAPKEPINTPETLPALAQLTSVELTPSRYLRWLSLLLGDLHMPLHWLRENNYGRELKVEYKGQEHTLLSFWEDYIPTQFAVAPSSKVLQKEYEEKSPGWWDTLPTELFREWAKETASVVCEYVYAPIQERNISGTIPHGTPFKVEEELFQRWLTLAQDLTTLGGHRLAFVLHDILEHKKHKAHAKEGRGRHHRKRSWFKNLGFNIMIGGFVIPLVVSVLRWHDRVGGPSLLWLARKHLKV